MTLADHLPLLPILVPLAAAAIMVPLGDRFRALKASIGVISTLACLWVAIALLAGSVARAPGEALIYRFGDWPIPFGIAFVSDRLSALMLTLTGIVTLSGLLFSIARWHKAGSFFHALVQFLLAGLNGVFLTGDIFNLFVFFEVLLAASYGLVLHGSGGLRVKAGLHYITVNLAASSVFLIGVSLIYAAAGTLNMADLAQKIPGLADAERTLLETGAAILGIAFLIKAGAWPLCFWLPTTYSVVAAPVAALFSIMTKVGIYAILRLWLLLFGTTAGSSSLFAQDVLFTWGLATMGFGLVGLLASQDLARLASFSVLVSSGTLLAVFATGNVQMTAGALFYLVVSTLTICAFFLLIELVERGRVAGADVIAVTAEAFGDDQEEEATPVGIALPATMAVLGLGFAACVLLLAGLPPLAGFLAKFLILDALFRPGPDLAAWLLLGAILLSGLGVMFALMRAGMRVFWVPLETSTPRVHLIEAIPIVGLLLVCASLTIGAGPVSRFMTDAADGLHNARPHMYGSIRSARGDSP